MVLLLGTAGVAAPSPDPDAQERRLLREMAEQGTNTARLFALGDYCHDLGVAGDKTAVPRAEAYLRQLLTIEPTNAPGLALLGSVYTLKGRDAFWPTTQVRLVQEGNRYMDEAVKLAPDDVATRLLRALNNTHMPDFLGRVEIVRADFEWLWARVDSHAQQMEPASRQNLALHWGRQLKRLKRFGEARQVWEKGLTMGADTADGRDIQAELRKLP